MLFLMTNQQHQSSEGKALYIHTYLHICTTTTTTSI